MGVDLTLIPIVAYKDASYSRSLLELNRCRVLWDEILALPSHEIPHPIGLIPYRQLSAADDEDVFDTAISDDYESILRFVTAADLQTLSRHQCVTDRLENKAAWAYLACLPGETKVALYWW